MCINDLIICGGIILNELNVCVRYLEIEIHYLF
jgi:hypothetical protein